MSYVLVRLSGSADRRHDKKLTLESLRLLKLHHATVVPENPSYKGMLKKVEHDITYGELDQDTAVKLLETRGRGVSNVDLDDDYVAEHTPYGSVEELATALVEDDVDLGKLDGIKPVFRLTPARGGFEGKKRHFNEGGSLGYRGEAINDLIERML